MTIAATAATAAPPTSSLCYQAHLTQATFSHEGIMCRCIIVIENILQHAVAS
jgi:hypothetical protein